MKSMFVLLDLKTASNQPKKSKFIHPLQSFDFTEIYDQYIDFELFSANSIKNIPHRTHKKPVISPKIIPNYTPKNKANSLKNIYSNKLSVTNLIKIRKNIIRTNDQKKNLNKSVVLPSKTIISARNLPKPKNEIKKTRPGTARTKSAENIYKNVMSPIKNKPRNLFSTTVMKKYIKQAEKTRNSGNLTERLKTLENKKTSTELNNIFPHEIQKPHRPNSKNTIKNKSFITDNSTRTSDLLVKPKIAFQAYSQKLIQNKRSNSLPHQFHRKLVQVLYFLNNYKKAKSKFRNKNSEEYSF